ncbi:FG-GAP repeat domain-containing protein [Streptomyces hydrogenans]|uniref:FG-GAP repeat domain-containing protein n=1 Tax=Streptomyces hydrogenans TaxID=1873719 RepID=UPI00381CE1BA
MSGPVNRRRASAAITTVLAVTLGAGVLAAPATAAPLPAAVPAGTVAETAPLPYPSAFAFDAVGKTGFLTRGWEGGSRPVSKWIRFADGSATTIDAPVTDFSGSDVIMTGKGSTPRRSLVLELRDMADGGRTVTMDLRPLNAVYVKAVSKDSILAEVTRADGSVELHLVTSTGGTLTQRKIEGIPTNAWGIRSTPVRDGAVLVDYHRTGDTTGSHAAVVDLATAKAVHSRENVPVARDDYREYSAVSATHLAWVGVGGTIVTTDRATGTESSFTAYDGQGLGLTAGLMGSWLAYGTPSSLEGDGYGRVLPVVPYTAKSLTTGETFKLLDYVSEAIPGPDGTLYARGGTVEQGDGLYRISLGADGRPTARMVATTGKPVELRYLGRRFPAEYDLASSIPLMWQLSRDNADIDLKITHRATGKSFSKTLHLYAESAGSPYLYGPGQFGITWAQLAADSQMGKDAEVGAYDWSFTARPQNGVGPDLRASGSFTAGRYLSTPHDLDWDGNPDLLARDAQGVLWFAPSEYDPAGKTLVRRYAPHQIGGGWQTYDRIETVGGIDPGATDFVARDRSGVLWLYDVSNRSHGMKIAARKRIGGGWNTYTQLTGGSDLDGDGRSDLVAVDKAGALWLYRNTGNVSAPFAARKKIGTGGWGVYNQITATGNIGGAAAGDLIARDKDGVLWLYLGKGDGTFTARRQIGGGWGAYTDTIGIGDADHDGRPDLFAYGPNKTAYFYPGTGDHRKPFGPRVASPVLTGQPAFNHVL